MKFIRAISILAIAYALIHTIPAARLDVVSGATKAAPKPAPAPSPAAPGSGSSSIYDPVVVPPANTSVSARLTIPSVFFFRVVAPDGAISYEPMTEVQAQQKLAALTEDYKSDAEELLKQKKEWEDTVRGEAFPVPPLPPPKVLLVKQAPTDNKSRADALKELKKEPRTWAVIEVTDNGATKVSRIPDETFGAVKNKLFDKYRNAVLAEKKRQADAPDSPAVTIPRPAIKIDGMFLSEEEATNLIAEREAALGKTPQKEANPPAAATQPASAG